MSTAAPPAPFPPWLVYAVFVLGVVAVGALIGTQTQPGLWYEALDKPPFNPPDWVFGPVWFALYVVIGVAGARIFLVDRRSPAMRLWVAQMVLNWLWSPVWFGLQLVWPAFAVIVLLLAAILGFIAAARRLDRPAAWLFAPYLAWVAFATVLNFSIGILN